MQVTIQNKVPITVVVEDITNTTNAISTGELAVGINNLVDVDVAGAEQGSMLMLVGSKWQAQKLDGGTFT